MSLTSSGERDGRAGVVKTRMRVIAELVTIVVGTITIATFVARYVVRRRKLRESVARENELLRAQQRPGLPPGEQKEESS